MVPTSAIFSSVVGEETMERAVCDECVEEEGDVALVLT